MEKQLKIKYTQECIEDKYSCGGGWIKRNVAGLDFCCAKNLARQAIPFFQEDYNEAGAENTFTMQGVNGLKFCPFCGAPVVFEEVKFDN